MPFSPLKFETPEDINYLFNALTKNNPGAKLDVNEVVQQLVVASDGNTYLYDDILQGSSSENLKFFKQVGQQGKEGKGTGMRLIIDPLSPSQLATERTSADELLYHNRVLINFLA